MWDGNICLPWDPTYIVSTVLRQWWLILISNTLKKWRKNDSERPLSVNVSQNCVHCQQEAYKQIRIESTHVYYASCLLHVITREFALI
jgi:hypothetical protein